MSRAPRPEVPHVDASATPESQLQAVVREMVAAMLAADTARLDALLTRDFTLVHMTGYEQPRQEWLSHIASGRMRYASAAERSIAVSGGPPVWRVRAQHRVQAHIWGMSGTWALQLDLDVLNVRGRWLIRAARASTC